jgi:hypothetical protein
VSGKAAVVAVYANASEETKASRRLRPALNKGPMTLPSGVVSAVFQRDFGHSLFAEIASWSRSAFVDWSLPGDSAVALDFLT